MRVLPRRIQIDPLQLRRLREDCSWHEAEHLLEDALSRWPANPQWHIERGQLRLAQGRPNDALDCFETAVAHAPHDEIAEARRIEALSSLRRDEEVDREGTAALQRFPDPTDLHLAMAQHYAHRYRHEDALNHCDLALAHRGDHPDALCWRARFLAELRDPRAEAAAAEALRVLGDEPAAHLAYATVLEKQHRFDEALEEIKKTLRLDGAHADALCQRISLLRQYGRFGDAERHGREAVADHVRPRVPKLHVALGRVFFDLQHFDVALESFNNAHAIDDHDIASLRWKAKALFRSGEDQWPEAENIVLEACEEFRDRSIADFHVVLGDFRAERGNHEAALKLYDKALSIDNCDVEALQGKITTLIALCQWADAENAAHAAIRHYPHSADLKVALGWVFVEECLYEKALEQFNDVLDEGDGKEIGALHARAAVLRSRRRWIEAEEAAQKMIELPDKVDGHVMLGWVLFGQGQYNHAMDEVENALKDNERSSWALATKTQFLAFQRRWKEAEEAGATAVGRLPHDPSQCCALGEVLRAQDKQEKYEDALPHLQRAFDWNQTNPRALPSYILTLEALQQSEAAETKALEVATAHKRSVDAHTVLGQLMDGRCRPDEARDHYDRALALNPLFEPAIVGKSTALRSLGCLDEAKKFIATKKESLKDPLELLVEEGMIEIEQGSFESAEAIFEKIRHKCASNEEKAERLAELGWVAFESGRYKDAAQQFDKAINLNPINKLEHQVGRAWVCVRNHQSARNPVEVDEAHDPLVEAHDSLVEALEQAPRNPLVHLCLGLIANYRKHYTAAEQYFKRTVELAPYSGGHVDLGSFYVQMGRFEEGLIELSTAKKLSRYDTRVHVELGNLYLLRSDSRDDAELAARHFLQAQQSSPDSGSAALGLAMAIERSRGDLKAAEETLRKAISRRGRVKDVSGGRVKDVSTEHLNVALARLLVQTGDEVQDASAEHESFKAPLYDDAISAAKSAITKNNRDPDAHFVAGIAAQRLASQAPSAIQRIRYRHDSCEQFKRCIRNSQSESTKAESERALQLLKASRNMWDSLIASVVVVSVPVLVLIAAWVNFLWWHDVSSTMITTLTPILIGLIAIGFLLPQLIGLKLPGGVEAQLSESLRLVSTGPPNVRLTSTRFTPTFGPRGDPSRLRWLMPKVWATKFSPRVGNPK